MNEESPAFRRESVNACRCDGRHAPCDHPLPCQDPPGGWRSPLFCVLCDQARIATIVAQLDEIAAAFGRRQQSHRDAAAVGLHGWERYFRGEQINAAREAPKGDGIP